MSFQSIKENTFFWLVSKIVPKQEMGEVNYKNYHTS